MAARVGQEVVKSPGNVTVTSYCTVKDITKTVTPDIKRPGQSMLIFVDLGSGQTRMGGTAFAQCYSQLGDSSPDVERYAWKLDSRTVNFDICIRSRCSYASNLYGHLILTFCFKDHLLMSTDLFFFLKAPICW